METLNFDSISLFLVHSQLPSTVKNKEYFHTMCVKKYQELCIPHQGVCLIHFAVKNSNLRLWLHFEDLLCELLCIPYLHWIDTPINDVSLPSITIDSAIVLEKLNSLKNGKAPGPDGWPAEVFKKYSDQLCTPLSILFVKSLESGNLPQYWKTGHITPIYKGWQD